MAARSVLTQSPSLLVADELLSQLGTAIVDLASRASAMHEPGALEHGKVPADSAERIPEFGVQLGGSSRKVQRQQHCGSPGAKQSPQRLPSAR